MFRRSSVNEGISAIMKVKSQHIFIMICAVWIILVMVHPEVQKMMEVMGGKQNKSN